MTIMNAAAYIAKQSSVKDDSRQVPECMRLLVKALQRGQSLGAAARFRLPSIALEPSCSRVLRSCRSGPNGRADQQQAPP